MKPSTLVSGGTGFVGRFIVEDLITAGHAVTVMGRSPPPDGFFSARATFVEGTLGPERDQRAAFEGIDNFVHAAFDHLPGKFRGGEGEDPDGFRSRNVDGTIVLLEAARSQGVERALFLSSRAVYGEQGAWLTEETEPRPDTLYGEVKLAAERHLDRMIDDGWTGASLRVTGVYGPAGRGREHKWAELFADYLAGKPVEPRVGTEVHGEDVAKAVRLLLTCDDGALARSEPATRAATSAFNVSDITVDRHDLLAIVKDTTGCAHPLPVRADASRLNRMATDRLRSLGWAPGGQALLDKTVRTLAGLFEPQKEKGR